MHGFKSFAKKEILKLSEGVTTVVGPNGCGKTNIVDAIRWVLGEQKSRVLRGGKMEDVIFNGAENMKPLSVCDVTLTVHNNKGKLPIEYNDIEIGRRVYRNGESEYTLNKTPCRLKDINDLFIDTGMGSDAYSVIELKMIEQILSENGDDRRRMFEEASGINKYRKQRKSTLRKFDATRFDLERISELIILYKKGKLTNLNAKKIFHIMLTDSRNPSIIMENEKMMVIDDSNFLDEIVKNVFNKNKTEFERLKKGEDKLIGFFMGQIMKASKGKADPQIIKKVINKIITE